jgi:serine/threonine protein kinase
LPTADPAVGWSPFFKAAMKLSQGDQIGAYTVEAMIGFGGMGHVYGGRHTQLDRAVAIKVLPEQLSRDSVALQRFRREALSASRLAHPHICTIYDFIEERGASFLVMEYLDGETLADRIAKAPIDEPEIIEIALQIANALAHAHGKGIVHRDLKPANVMLTPGGVKILDFGLAKDSTHIGSAIAAERNTAGIATHVTSPGTVVGTVPYMAPEQVASAIVDARADIYALGVIIFEMSTGRLPYDGTSLQEIIHAKVTGQPDPFASLADRSSKLMKLAERCMALRPADRWESAAEVATALRSARPRTTAWLRPAQTRTPRRFVEFALVGAVAIGLTVASIVVYSATRTAPPSEGALTFDLQPPAGVSLTQVLTDAALSPDGRTVLFSGSDSTGFRLWIRSVTTASAGALPNTEGAHTPFWSPDGTRLGYFARGYMWISDLSGDRPQRLAPASLESRGASWGPRDDILYSPGPNQGLLRLSLATGRIDTLSAPDRAAGHVGHLWPHFLPDGKHFLYFVPADGDSAQGIYVGSTDNERGRRLTFASGNALFANGQLLFLREQDVFAQPFDVSDLVLGGRAVPVLRDVSASYTYQGAFSASNTGVLVYSAANTKSQSRMVSMDDAGNGRAYLTPPQQQTNPAISFDGNRLAYELFEGTDSDIAVLDLTSGRVHRLADPALQAKNPTWSSDSYELAYVTEEAAGFALYIWNSGTGSPPRRAFVTPHAIMPSDWSLDDGMLLSLRGEKGYDVFKLQLNADPLPKPMLDGEGHQASAEWSPDGSRVAYMATSTGSMHVYVADYPLTSHRCQISAHGGWMPHWGANDTTLYFLDPVGVVMKANIPKRGGCPRDAPIALMRPGLWNPAASASSYVVHPGNGTLIFNIPDSTGKPPVISAIVNWPDRLPMGMR